uniref:WD repeat domain phosphoinositide-interacting protein 2 n=1 Tax=Syphacia muris TaxID=451379 RepID=A0A0N5AJG2_9BILA
MGQYGEAVRYVERLFSACFVAYVLRKSPRKINAFHLEKRRKFCTQCYANTVVTIKMNREVCLDLLIFQLVKVSHQICDIPENKKGIIDITTDGVSMIAYPGAAETGRGLVIIITIHLIFTCAPSLSICAHTSPLAALRFNPDGKFLATSSVKGTVIRIFNVQTAERCYEFTRVNCMGFSENSKYLCLSSNTETVHVFKLEESVSDIQPETSSWTDYFAKAASSYLPTQVNELISREKSFATARLPKAGVKNVAALRIIKSELYLMVATADGFLYCFVVDPNGGECAIKFQHRIGNEVLFFNFIIIFLSERSLFY